MLETYKLKLYTIVSKYKKGDYNKIKIDFPTDTSNKFSQRNDVFKSSILPPAPKLPSVTQPVPLPYESTLAQLQKRQLHDTSSIKPQQKQTVTVSQALKSAKNDWVEVKMFGSELGEVMLGDAMFIVNGMSGIPKLIPKRKVVPKERVISSEDIQKGCDSLLK